MRLSNRNLILLAFDMVCFAIVSAAYYIISLALSSVEFDLPVFLINVGVLFGVTFISRLVMGMYGTLWRYTSTKAYFKLVLSDAVSGLVSIAIAMIGRFTIGFWPFVTITALSALMTLSSRFVYRLIYKKNNASKLPSRARTNVAIVGAGQLGVFLVNELTGNPNSLYVPTCFIEVDSDKVGTKLSSLPVLSHEEFVKRQDDLNTYEVVIAIAYADSEKLTTLREVYEKLGCKVKLYGSSVQDEVEDGKRVIREFQIEDLLFRNPIKVDFDGTKEFYRGKVVLVTGGGGSIGSELCRKIALCNPEKLIAFDIYENNIYDIQQELWNKYGTSLDFVAEIGSVRDVKRLDYIFDKYRPDVVFHAAAHKHVPLMEHSCTEAIKNNVLGTYNTANAAEKYGVKKFILISTDKAVNPTNIMGATKRLCEMIIQCRQDSKTSFSAVRFGNVLGSNGSVIPLFKRQIAKGGPVTVTDKRIIRYFMTIPEASQLVITAGSMAKSGELFVLDMGKPVKIYDLAVNMIKLSGLIPEIDIQIVETGLRPGEKLYEELLMKTETLDKTSNDLIFIEKDDPLSRDAVEKILDSLRASVIDYEENGNLLAIKEAIRASVPTFRDPEEINRTAERSEEMRLSAQSD